MNKYALDGRTCLTDPRTVVGTFHMGEKKSTEDIRLVGTLQ